MGLFKRENTTEKKEATFSEKVSKILVIIGIPSLGVVLGAIYLLINDLNQSNLDNKKAQIEMLGTLGSIKDATIQSKDAQLEIAKSLSSDKVVVRLLEAKEAYEIDLAKLQREIIILRTVMDSIGIGYNRLGLAYESIEKLQNENSLLLQQIAEQKNIWRNQPGNYRPLPFQNLNNAFLSYNYRKYLDSFVKDDPNHLTSFGFNPSLRYTFSSSFRKLNLNRESHFDNFKIKYGIPDVDISKLFYFPTKFNFFTLRGLTMEPNEKSVLVLNVEQNQKGELDQKGG